MPIISGKKQHATSDLFSGRNEKEKFVRGIKERREGTENQDPLDYFFDPATSELTTPMGMMTRYISKGIPNVARRLEGTRNFLERMKILGPDAERASSLFAERYPRVAAHINVEHMPSHLQAENPTADAFTAMGFRSKGQFPEQTPVLFGRGSYSRGQHNIEDTLLHEGTHVAQDLGNKNSLAMYHESKNALKKLGANESGQYYYNPFEISPRTVAERKLGKKVAPYSALRGVDKLVESLPAGDPTRIELGKLRRSRSVGPTIEAAAELKNSNKAKLFK